MAEEGGVFWRHLDRGGRLLEAAKSYVGIVESLWRTDTAISAPGAPSPPCEGVAAATEEEWQECDDPQRMLASLIGRTSDRKLRLWACACWRKIEAENPSPTPDPKAIDVAERFADGLATKRELERWGKHNPAFDLMVEEILLLGLRPRYHSVADRKATWAAESAASWVKDEQRRKACALFRHHFGDPFHPYLEVEWPSAIVELAQSLYAGKDAAFALVDALLEFGYPDLAEHFRQEMDHPKGCWVVDMLTGRD